MNTLAFPTLTVSRASSLVCPKQFYELHVLGKRPHQGFSPQLAYGSLVHETLKGAFDPRIKVEPADRALHALARQAAYRQGYPSAAARDADVARCLGTVEAYVAQESGQASILDVEAFASFEVSCKTLHPLTISAKLDCLLVRPSEPECLVIRDYKTGVPRGIDLTGACIMLAVARTCYREYHSFRLEYDYLHGQGLKKRVCVSFADAKDVWPDLLARAVRVYDAHDFPAEPGEHCCWCPLRAECQPPLTVSLEELERLFR